MIRCENDKEVQKRSPNRAWGEGPVSGTDSSDAVGKGHSERVVKLSGSLRGRWWTRGVSRGDQGEGEWTVQAKRQWGGTRGVLRGDMEGEVRVSNGDSCVALVVAVKKGLGGKG